MSLQYECLKPQEFMKTYNAEYADSKPQNLKSFKAKVEQYLESLEAHKNQNEKGIASNALMPFLQSLGFQAQAAYKHKGNSEIDLALFKNGAVEILIEAKKPENTSEMFSPNNPNCKALHECILYYLREREGENPSLMRNPSVRYILITDFYRFYIFGAGEFKRCFYKNKQILKAYQELKNAKKTKNGNIDNQAEFYNEISKILNTRFSGDLEGDIFNTALQGTSFDLRNDKHLEFAHRILNRDFLHNEFTRDSNALNPHFYFELLHILGLKENSEKGKILIQIDQSQNTSFAKHLYDKIREKSPQNSETELFEATMSHIIIYLNRILFLKLIEANLLHFNDFDKSMKFLTSDKIRSFKTLRHLFFEVLAKDYEHRESGKSFDFLPYLNSSLFMRDEKEILDLSTFDDDLQILPFSTTQTEYKKDQKVAFLAYLFDFLECWDFGKSEDTTSSDKLISSSVLGAMFEKLNGYKEGSFYTPNFITSFMCRKSLSKVVCEKFNASFGWDTKDLDSLRKQIDRNFAKEAEFKKLLESLKICDPAVGSGHFLISALSEMIYIYHKLGLLGFGYKDLKVIDDEILLTTKNNENFAYKRFDDENHQIQIALFNLKKSIIENNLFGVDINPNSCNIARLRLWIELLKSAYYLEDGFKGKIHKLQTLPNIDINIKCGNSLVSHFPTFEYDKNQNPERYTFAWLKNGENSQAFINNFKEKLLRYNHLVQIYKEKLGDKQEIEKEIKGLKAFFKDMLLKNSFTMKSLEDALRAFVQTYGDECFDMETPFGMEMIKIIRDKNRHEKGYKFQPTLDQLEPSPIDKKGQDLLNEIYKAYLEIENLKNQETFEWRFEFPEVLDLETFEEKQARIGANNLAKQNHQSPQKIKDTFGDFLGFDLVIGNPPYIRQEEIKHLKPHLQKAFKIYKGTSDIYTYFFELGTKILKNNGILSFITSNKWCRAAYGEPLREFLLENTTINTYVDLNGIKVFESATVDTSILEFIKGKAPKAHTIEYANPKDYNPKEDKPLEPKYSQIPQSSLKAESFIFSDSKLTALKAKIEAKGTPLKDWDINIYRGVLTGYNDAFIIDTNKREEILAKCDDSKASLLPYSLSEYDKNLNDTLLATQRSATKVAPPYQQTKAHIDGGAVSTAHNGTILLTERERTAQLIKPILRGRDIKRYSYEWAGLWIIFVAWHFPNTNNPKSMQENEQDLAEQYPSLYSHLLQHKDRLSKRNKDETGIRYEWYCLQRWGANYYQEFSKPKIVYSEIVREPQFYLDNGEFKFGHFYAEATSFILSGNENFKDSLEYLLGILHSKLATFAFKEFYAGGGLGESGYRYKKAFLEKLPIPKISKKQELEFVKIVKEMLQIKQTGGANSFAQNENDQVQISATKVAPPSKANTYETLEMRLDSMVYALYDLSNEEIAIIGGGGQHIVFALLLIAAIQSRLLDLVKILCENFESELKEAFRFCEGLKMPYISKEKYEGKIIYPNMAKEFIAYLDTKGFFTNQKCFILTDNIKDKDRLLYLSAVLNSKTNFWYFKQIGATLGASGYEMSKIFVERLPIVETQKIDSKILSEIETLAREILETKTLESSSENISHCDKNQSHDNANLESRLDSLIYQVYDLTHDEINLIESEFKKAERERVAISENLYHLLELFVRDCIGQYQGKILYPCIMAKEPCFMYEEKGFFAPAPANLITGKEKQMKYLTGLLNSQCVYFAMRRFYMGGGIEGELKTNNLLKLPIPKITQSNQSIADSIITLSDEILNLKAKDSTTDTTHLESEIDILVYKLYNLTDAEIKIIESKIKP